MGDRGLGAVADVDPHELGAATLEHGIRAVRAHAHLVPAAVVLRAEADVEVVAEREPHEPAARELQRRDRVGVAVAAPEVALLRVVDVDERGVERALAGALGRVGAGRANGIQVPRRSPGENHDEAEEDQASVHGT